MVTSREQAERVQNKRVSLGLKGVSKAVRRFNKRTSHYPGGWDLNLTHSSNFDNCRSHEETYKNEILGTFVIDQRMVDLEERLLQYYNETMFGDNKYAMSRWKAFKDWAIGYTNKEISQAKKIISNRFRD